MLVNSVPLSETIMAGRPRIPITASSSRATRKPGRDDQNQAFAREVVDEGQNAEAATVDHGVRQEVQAPALIGTLRQGHRRPRSERSLAAAAVTHLKPFLAIKPAEPLVVQDNTLAPEQDVQPSIAEPPPNARQLAPPCACCRIVRSMAPVAHRATIGAKRRTRPPLADLMGDLKVSDGLTPGGGRHHFFAATSLSMALSSIASASNFFSFVLSSSSAYRRFASDTSSPPYLAFHL